MSNWKPAAAPLTSRTCSHVSRSSECLRKHFGFLILNAIFSQMKCQIKKIFSGFLIDIEIYRISIFQQKKIVCHLTFNHFSSEIGGISAFFTESFAERRIFQNSVESLSFSSCSSVFN